MEMIVDFPGGSRVDAHFRGLTVATDQPRTAGGEDTAPSPYETFLAAVGTCAGIYVLGFCRQRRLPTEGIRLVQRVVYDPATKLAARSPWIFSYRRISRITTRQPWSGQLLSAR